MSVEGLIFLALLAGAAIAGLFVAFWLLVGAVEAWPLSLILAVVGGFIGGGVGAVVGVAIGGVVGLLVVLAKLSGEF